MSYDAIIFDLDGTAVPSLQDSMPSEALVDATTTNRDKVHLCIATGRSWPFTKHIAEAMQLIDPCILSGGAVIMDPVKQEILWQEIIDPTSLNELIETSAQHNFGRGYAAGAVFKTLEPGVVSAEASDVNAFYVFGILPQEVEGVIETLNHIPHIMISKAGSWEAPDRIDLHITNIQATKEHAVFELCKLLEVNPLNVAGVGDGYNDVHLFNAVGHKVAMGNSVDELKEIADQVIDSQENDGLAEFIKTVAGEL